MATVTASADLSAAVDADGHAGTILLKTRLGGVSAVALFDTGAQTNFLAQHFVEKHALHERMKPSKHSVRYADGSVKPARGELTLPLELLLRTQGAQFKADTRFIVAELQHQFDVILGIPFCRAHEPRPDWAEMTIRVLDQRPGRN